MGDTNEINSYLLERIIFEAIDRGCIRLLINDSSRVY